MAPDRALVVGVGQSYATIGTVRNGKTDTYPPAGRITTSALAEGAIEGKATCKASDYEMANSHATAFVFSRFDDAEGTLNKGASTDVVDASATESRLSAPTDTVDAALSRRLQEDLLNRLLQQNEMLLQRVDRLEARNTALEGPANTPSAGFWPYQSRRLSETSTACCTAIGQVQTIHAHSHRRTLPILHASA